MPLEKVLLNETHVTLAASEWPLTCRETNFCVVTKCCIPRDKLTNNLMVHMDLQGIDTRTRTLVEHNGILCNDAFTQLSAAFAKLMVSFCCVCIKEVTINLYGIS